MDQSRINAIRARCEAATPEPWTADLSEGDCGVYSEDCPRGLEYCDDACPQCDRWEILKGGLVDGPDYVECGEYSYFSDNDAEFIAHARADIPDLLAEVERLTRELEAAKRDIRELLFDDGLTRCECCAHLDQCDPDYDCSEDAQEQPNHFLWDWRGLCAENQSGGSTDMVGEAHD